MGTKIKYSMNVIRKSNPHAEVANVNFQERSQDPVVKAVAIRTRGRRVIPPVNRGNGVDSVLMLYHLH